MVINVLVLETYADEYARHLRAQFEGLAVHPVRSVAELEIDLAEIDVLIAFGVAITDEVIRRATRLKWIQSLATGVDHFLRCPSLKSGTLLTSSRGIHGPAMRETVAYLMLSVSRGTRRLARNQDAHRWDRGAPWPLMARKTAVVVGTGVGGSAIGALLQAFGMWVIGVSRTPRQESGFDEMVHLDALGEVVRRADYLVNIMPGGPANAGLFSRAVFAAMKPTAFFINVGRGDTVDEVALIDALRDQRIAGAGLDVVAVTPLPADSPLWDLPNVFLTPFNGGLFDEYEEYVLPIVTENMRLFLAGRTGEMRNIVPH
jgi:phosphoglycerate dehydrogenase-like enzyme